MNATAKRPRRKYRYPSREAAETAQTDTERERINQLRLARALFAGRVDWTRYHGSYRFGVFDQETPNGPRVVQVFAPDGQEPDLRVIDPRGDELTTTERAALRYNDGESKQILAAIREVRGMYSLS